GGERLARLRAAVPAPAAGRAAPPSRRTLRGLLWVLLALCALALLATFLPPFRDAYLDRVERGEPRVTVAPLPPPEPPRVRLDPDAQLLAHRDFALLASDAPPAPEALAFASWLAAQQDPARPPPAPLVPREGTAEEEARALGLTEDADAPAR
ncbi:MAG TPA: hypothetical protein VEY50_00670, partial [Lysobacter sp.]|nr:hypothetical protein [Lysobacter sp.]